MNLETLTIVSLSIDALLNYSSLIRPCVLGRVSFCLKFAPCVQLSENSATWLANAATAAPNHRNQFTNACITVANIRFPHTGYEGEEPQTSQGFFFIALDQTAKQVLVARSVPQAEGMSHSSILL